METNNNDVGGLTDEQRDAVRTAIAEALGEAYDCTRVWSAWSYGTMGPSDFVLVAEDDARLDEIATAAIGAIASEVLATRASADVGGLTEIAGVNIERLLRNLDETNYNEGSDALACRLRDCERVIKELLATRAPADLSGLTIAHLNAAFNEEIKRVSSLDYPANSMCRTFYDNLVARVLATLPAHQAVAAEPVQVPEWLSSAIKENGNLYSLGRYLSWDKGAESATLDGDFSAGDLRAIAAHMDGATSTPPVAAHQAAVPEGVRAAGAKMANTMFNLAQGDLGPALVASFKEMQKEWDAALRAVPPVSAAEKPKDVEPTGWNRNTLVERLYNDTPTASLNVEAGAEIQRLNAKLVHLARKPAAKQQFGDSAGLTPEYKAAQQAKNEALRERLNIVGAKMPCGAVVTNVFEAYKAGKNAAHLVGHTQAAPVGLTSEHRKTLEQIAAWLNSSANIVQNGPDDFGPASQFDYELGQAGAEITAILAAPTLGSVPQAEIPTNAPAQFAKRYTELSAENRLLKARIAALEAAPVAQEAEQMASAQAAPTDLSKRLRAIAAGVKPNDPALVTPQCLTDAADEIDRYYGGMLAWKKTAEKKDRDRNAERMARENDRIAARNAGAQAAPADISESVDTAELRALLANYSSAVGRERPLSEWDAARAAIIAHITSLITARVAGVRKDAERYRWLRSPTSAPALVIDKVTGAVPADEMGGGGFLTYEYRAGEELDAAIDAAMADQSPASSSQEGGAA